mgnify:CR=1 FL=1
MVVSFVALITIIATAGFFLARSYESERWIAIMAPTLKYSLYTIVDGPNWTQAETEAKRLGGNLITINNNAEPPTTA